MAVSVLYPSLPSITITPPDTFTPPSPPKVLRITPPSETHEGETNYDLAQDNLPEWKQSRYVEERHSRITRRIEERIKAMFHRGPKPALQAALLRPNFLTAKRWEPQPRPNLAAPIFAAPNHLAAPKTPPGMTFQSVVRWIQCLFAAWFWFGVFEYLGNCGPTIRISGYGFLVAQLVLIIPPMVVYASPVPFHFHFHLHLHFLSPLARPAYLANQSVIRFMQRARHKLIKYRIYAVAVGFFGLGFCTIYTIMSITMKTFTKAHIAYNISCLIHAAVTTIKMALEAEILYIIAKSVFEMYLCLKPPLPFKSALVNKTRVKNLPQFQFILSPMTYITHPNPDHSDTLSNGLELLLAVLTALVYKPGPQ
ncbi:hypothetical protein CspHIS471_0702970 [Cutaneotrichosporon sp. HIS471]|nr:hypothetical protein CspHIS471_0702970 [Cutaneotrichosporon sp. HIS471]